MGTVEQSRIKMSRESEGLRGVAFEMDKQDNGLLMT